MQSGHQVSIQQLGLVSRTRFFPFVLGLSPPTQYKREKAV